MQNPSEVEKDQARKNIKKLQVDKSHEYEILTVKENVSSCEIKFMVNDDNNKQKDIFIQKSFFPGK